jgi:hypothetical protein
MTKSNDNRQPITRNTQPITDNPKLTTNKTMFKNYLKIAFRNIRINKLRSGIYILGLSLGIAICFLISNVVAYSYSFDRFHPDMEQIFRINTISDWGDGESFPNSGTPGPLGDVIDQEVAGIMQKARLYTISWCRIPETIKLSEGPIW